ncbi:MAG: hypothetical protein WCO28_10110 [Bacteroidota bacterium]|jgi:hypothetical protein
MKKFFAIAFVTIAFTSCHYGQADAQKTIETNEQYKNEKSDYSTNRGNDGVRPENTTPVDSAKVDTTKIK